MLDWFIQPHYYLGAASFAALWAMVLWPWDARGLEPPGLAEWGYLSPRERLDREMTDDLS